MVSVLDGLFCVVLNQDGIAALLFVAATVDIIVVSECEVVVALLFVTVAVGVVFVVVNEYDDVAVGVGLTVRRKVDFGVGGFDDKRSTTVFSHSTRNRLEHGSYWNCKTPPELRRVIHELDLESGSETQQ